MLKKSQDVMDHLSSPLEGSTHVCFSRGGGVSHRIAGGKPHLKKSKPATFHKVVPLASYFWSFKSTKRYAAKN